MGGHERVTLCYAPMTYAPRLIRTQFCSFLTKVKAQLDAPGSVTEKEFTAMEDRLVKLGEVSIDTSPEMTAFCADAVPNTPRPFLFRTVAIVRTLEHLDQYSLLPQNKALNGHRYDLKL